MKRPFFIIGTERSGTNLLRMILNYGPDVSIAHPPHFLKNLAGLEGRFGDLSIDSNLNSLVKASLTFLELHPYQWNLKVSASEVTEYLTNSSYPRSVLGIQSTLYDFYARREGKERWGCKSTFSVRHIHEIKRDLPDALFVQLVRDPRDVAASAKKSQFNHFHPYFSAKLWQEEQLMASSGLASYPDSFYVLRYEDLITSPSTITKDLCQFLGIEFTESMLSYHQGSEAKKSSSLSRSWMNTGREILSSNSGNFERGLSLAEVSLVESQCYIQMKDFNYPLQNALCDLERLRFKLNCRVPWRFYLSDFLQMILMQLSLFKSDKNNGLRIAKFWFVKALRIRLLLGPKRRTS